MAESTTLTGDDSPAPLQRAPELNRVARHPLARGIRRLNAAVAVASAGVGLAIMAALTVGVLWRHLTNASIPGLVELVETMMVLLVYLGIGHAEHTGAHVRMTIVTGLIPPVWRRRLIVVTRLIVVLAALLFIVGTGQRAIGATIEGEYRPGLVSFPIWPARSVIALGYVLLLLEGLVKLAESLFVAPDELFPPEPASTATETMI